MQTIISILLLSITQFIGTVSTDNAPKVNAPASQELSDRPFTVGVFCAMNTGIYIIESPTGKIYVGQSINLKQRMRMYKNLCCKSQGRIYHSLKKYGWQAHKVEVILPLKENIQKEFLSYWEQFFIDYYRNEGIELMNLKDSGLHKKYSEETKNKMSLALRGRPKSEKESQRLRTLNVGRKFTPPSPEVREKIRQAHLGKKRSEQAKLNMSKAQKGHKVSEKEKQRLRTLCLGRIVSQETRNKIRNKHKGRHVSQETRDKISIAKTGKKGNPLSSDHKNKISLANIGKPKSLIHRKRLSIAAKTNGNKNSKQLNLFV